MNTGYFSAELYPKHVLIEVLICAHQSNLYKTPLLTQLYHFTLTAIIVVIVKHPHYSLTKLYQYGLSMTHYCFIVIVIKCQKHVSYVDDS